MIVRPTTPLHHLLLQSLGVPVVATSGNLSDEPICIDGRSALERLRGIADVFLRARSRNRPSYGRLSRAHHGGTRIVLRRARGYAPLPVQLTQPVPSSSRSRRAFEEYRRAERRLERFCQPAHR